MRWWIHRGHMDRFGCRFPLDLAADLPEQLRPVDREWAQPVAVRALADTGAQASMVSQELASWLRLLKVGTAMLSGTVASARVGIVTALLFLPSEDSIGRSGRPVQLLIGEVRAADLLFSLDLLRGGIFTLDGVTGAWSWSLERLPWPEQSALT